MSVIANNIVAGAAGQGGAAAAYQIDRSVRLNSADSAHFSRTPSSAGNRKTWTWSGWVKRSALGSSFQTILGAGTGGNSEASIRFNSDDTIEFYAWTGGYNARLVTNQVFRDTSAWYHFVFVFDTPNATADQRIRMYVNGIEVTTFSSRTNPTQNYDGYFNNSISHTIGDAVSGASPRFFNGYLADVHFIDGQALAPTDFGEYDSNNVWQPKEYSGTYVSGTDYLADLTINGTLYVSGNDPANAFDGSTSTQVQLNNNAQNQTITFAPTGGIPYTSSVEVYIRPSGNIAVTRYSVNGGSDQSLSGTDYWQTILSGSGTFNSFVMKQGAQSNSVGFAAIRVDGTILVQGTGFNSFHLPFSDNSSNAALGDDSSGNNNDWTVNNLAVVGSNTVWDLKPNGTNWTNIANAFDSSTSTYADGTYNTGTTSRIRFNTPLTGVTKLRLYWGGTSTYGYNNTTVGTGPGSSSPNWVTAYTGTAITVDSIIGVSQAGDGVVRLYAIEVNDSVITGYTRSNPADNDSLVDTPTNYEADSGNNGGNYCTGNPLNQSNSDILKDGNLHWDVDNTRVVTGTHAMSSGKWYWEATVDGIASFLEIGIVGSGVSFANQNNTAPGTYSSGFAYRSNATKINNNSSTSYGASFVAGDVIGVAFDAGAGTLTFYKNGSTQGTAFTGIASSSYVPCAYGGSGAGNTGAFFNFGQRPFAYTPPTGFKSLCTTNLTDPTIADGSTAMDVVLYTGNGSTQTITGLNFSPDLVWLKDRSFGNDHMLTDTVRGATKALRSNSTITETTNAQFLTAFTSDGFSVGSNGNFNANTNAFVSWAWDAGTTTATNNNGSIQSTVRANASAGFSIVKAPITSSGGTIGHGLNASPGMLILKNIGSSSTNWVVWHSSFSTNDYILLNSTAAKANSVNLFNGNSSTTFTVGSGFAAGTADYICYCFAPVAGYSAFGSYTGNGSSDGPFVYTGHRSKWLMIKCSSSNQAGNAWWLIYDSKRLGYNPDNAHLGAQTSSAEYNASPIDLTSNGFKLRDTNTSRNASGATYIWASFAESPFKYSRAR